MRTNEIPYRFMGVEAYGEDDEQCLISSECSIIFGNYGTGKTWLAYSVIKTLIDCGDYSDFELLTEVELITTIKDGFKDNTANDRIERFKEVDLLVIDEMGKSPDKEYSKSQIFEILNYRYNWIKRTILICNASEKKELQGILSPGIYDRYRGNIVEMSGATRRHKKWVK